jgi:two-component system CheB/CheR fusion protein
VPCISAVIISTKYTMNESPGPQSIGLGAEPAGDRERTSASGVSVVGIGASAGGLEAFRLLLGNLPADTGFAFVLVQHLDPTHQSSLSQILARATTMPVTEAGDGVRAEPNHVYAIPPNTELTIAERVLKLSPRGQTPGPHMPIDHFLRSLAQDCRRRAIGVILSGAGSDGSLGLQAVKEAGGVTFAQEPATAEFASMPRMAEAAACVDFVLPPARIAQELARLAHHPHFAVAQTAEPETPPKEGNDGLNEILTVMHETTGIDFSLYRETTVRRRIMRRLALRNIASIEAYAAQLKQDPGERSLLRGDLLISVTSFFRDPGSFDGLTRLAFPAIVRNRPAGTVIRVWVPGCATGEEAYSIGIALQEYLKETGAAYPVQIFASDIGEAAIEKARSGKYLENIAADVSPERLNRHFTKVEGGYQVGKALRELCVFSKHNLIDDPPFARLDLISCRNVLIYLGAVQKNIIPMFHYALNPTGFLILGQAETANFDDMFSIIDRDHRIYAKREIANRPHQFHALAAMSRRGAVSGKIVAQAPISGLWDGADVGKAVDGILLSKYSLSKYSPAAVLVDEGLEVLEIRGDAAPFFRLPAGKVTFHLLKLIPDTGLFLEIEKLAHEAADSGEAARRARVPYELSGSIHEVNIEVTPLFGHQKRALLVLLEPAQRAEEPQVGESREPRAHEAAIAGRDRHIAKLRQEVLDARRRLLSVIEEHQISDEASQSATAEALSANEELQSLNEELETAKEELQSTNEELITVNQEVESKNRALTESRNFANLIVGTVRIPLLVLDNELRIKSVNESFSKTFLIPPGDAEGQFLYSLGRGSWDIPGLRQRLDRVLTAAESFDHFEVAREFPSIGTRDLIINGRRLDGLDQILVAIDDVTVRKEAEKALQRSQEALRQAQKMEAVGRLAGGIAHDFNNLLTAIIGYSHLVADSLGASHQAIGYVHEIESAGQRAAALTDQLLAFSRRKLLQPKVFDVNGVVADFERMLRRVVGDQIKVMVRPAADLWRVRADSGEIGRALMNLCLNARDAMPAGGTLTIQTANVTIGEAEAGLHNLGAGQYVELIVRDTGIGMDPETQTHVFEPFFTTKETGKGTGLGLATVLGIVEQSGGAILCHSEPGQGTRFKILLPAIALVPDRGKRPAGGLAEAPKGSAEVVLLVEDEDQVRKLASTILEGRGYVVLEARDGREGLAVCQAHQGKIDLLLSDVVMPELGGRELAERILAVRPDIKVLFMSGHTQDIVLKEGIEAGTPFLQKPFGPTDLAHKVREVLDSQGRSQIAGKD